MSGSEQGVRMMGEGAHEAGLRRDRLVGWTTSEKSRGST